MVPEGRSSLFISGVCRTSEELLLGNLKACLKCKDMFEVCVK